MTLAALVVAMGIGFIAVMLVQRRSEAENDARMKREIVRLGQSIAEALKTDQP